MLLQEDVEVLRAYRVRQTPLRRWSWRPGGTIASAAAEGAAADRAADPPHTSAFADGLRHPAGRRRATLTCVRAPSSLSSWSVPAGSATRRCSTRPRSRCSTAFEAVGVDAPTAQGPGPRSARSTRRTSTAATPTSTCWSPRRTCRSARSALTGVGYKHAEEIFGIDDVGEILHAETWSRRVEVGSGGPLLIDLHWRLPGCEASADAAWKALAPRRASIELNGREAAVLDREASRPAPRDPRRPARARRPQGDRRPHPWARALAARRSGAAAASLAAELEATPTFAAGLRLVPIGAERADELGLPPTDELDWAIRHRDLRPRGTFHLEALTRARGARARADVLRRSLLPKPRVDRLAVPVGAGSRAAARRGLRRPPAPHTDLGGACLALPEPGTTRRTTSPLDSHGVGAASVPIAPASGVVAGGAW